ncbi:hypothetical protein [Thermoproteus tenax]|nr:hypothetical protein [Thermoproteus tenax]
MLRGAVSSVLSSDPAKARRIAERLGKRARDEEGCTTGESASLRKERLSLELDVATAVNFIKGVAVGIV